MVVNLGDGSSKDKQLSEAMMTLVQGVKDGRADLGGTRIGGHVALVRAPIDGPWSGIESPPVRWRPHSPLGGYRQARQDVKNGKVAKSRVLAC